ncbi:VOC family protein [Scatolibacter rhodanostii]|uniref:VOC family protein n=1 Tax=Scatolibacter rhodanostii TaxID=2014781 RepID=UPI000C08381A|nr:glyoxalase/bleomycin resistance/extradiol dioxygenase family protein [Scatolibacter rhodanostii]
MLIITPNLHFNGQCKKAIEIYKQAFGANVMQLIYDDEDLVFHAELNIDGCRIILSDSEGESSSFGNSMSLIITFDTADEVKRTFSLFEESCKIIHPIQKTDYSSCFVSFIDKFGIRWELMTEQTLK